MFSRANTIIFSGIRSGPVIALGLLVCTFHTASAQANWRIIPSLGVGYEYDDNATLFATSALETPADGVLVEADAQFIYESQLTNFSLVPQLQLSRYDVSALDADNFFLDMNYKYQGQRSTFEVFGIYSDESERTAERADVDLDVDNPDLIPNDDSGQVLSVENRQRIQIRPRWWLNVGERSRILLGADYIDVDYDESGSLANTDYDQTSGEASYEFDINEKTAISLNGYYRDTYFGQLGRDFSGYGSTLGLVHRISERTSLLANIGVDSTEDLTDDKDNNAIGNISLIHNTQTSRVLASYRRSVTGTGSGVISVRDSINLNVTRQVSPKVSIGGGVAAYSAEALGQNMASVEDRDYIQLRALLTWNITRVFSVDFDYRYTNLDREILPSDADSNRINIWFRYQAFK